MFPESSDLKFFIIIGILVMLILTVSFLLVFIINQKKKLEYQQSVQQLRVNQQNQLIEAAIKSEEIERHRIAEVLHDEVGAILSSAKLHLMGIKDENLDARDKQLHNKGRELLDEVIHIVRGISHNLHSNILKEFGLNEAIKHFTTKLTHGSMIKASFHLDESYTGQHEEKDITIYRINNIIKHATATTISITSNFDGKDLQLTILNDGIGITQEEFEALRYKQEGLGLKNIQNRIILLRGTIQFQYENEEQKIILHIPVNVNV
jgi:two-component system, NarL family, sensor kinase